MTLMTRYGRRTGAIGGYYAARTAWKAGAGAGRIMKKWLKSGSSKKTVAREDTNSGTSASTFGNLTSQFDTARLYRKRRAPRRVRRRAKRFMRSLKWGMDKLQGMKCAIINNATNFGITPTSKFNGQGTFAVTMYGYGNNTYAANTNYGNGDVWWIMSRENGGDPTADSATRKLRFRSCVMNVNIINTTENAPQNIIVDVYHILCKQSGNNVGNTGDPAELLNECTREMSGTNFPTEITNGLADGVTPFDVPTYGRYITVKSVRRYRLDAGAYFNLQLRDPGNYVLSMADLNDVDFKKNITEGYLFVYYNAACDNTGVRYPASCQINYSKKYHYTETSTSQSQIGQ